MPDDTGAMVRSRNDELAAAAGCWFDPEAAERVRTFFREFLRHSKGRWAGQVFELLPWQWDGLIKPLFGWKRADGSRRFRKAYAEVAKKNGKSTLAAGISLYMLVGDDEPGAEIYSAAADRDQAGIIYREAEAMVNASPELKSHVETIASKKRIVFRKTGSFYQALSRESGTNEGLNAHAVTVDELHAQKTRQLWDTLVFAGAAREQPLVWSITTAGWDRTSICWEQHEYAQGVIDGTIEDWSFFGLIYAADEKDDWTSEETWKKANPSYGVTIKADEMREACQEAQASPTKENAFRRYRLSQWTDQDVRWVSSEAWDVCDQTITEAELVGVPCWAGLDLSSTTDLASLGMAFDLPGDLWAFLWKLWAPRENAERREHKDKVPYLTWAKQGYITLTEGNVIDYETILRDVVACGERFSFSKVAVDRFQAEHLMQLLAAEGMEIVAFSQGIVSISPPTKALERMIIGGRIIHNQHPVLRWMLGGCKARIDDNENVKLSKQKSTTRIDGIVAAIMAIGRSMIGEEATVSVYESRGMLSV